LRIENASAAALSASSAWSTISMRADADDGAGAGAVQRVGQLRLPPELRQQRTTRPARIAASTVITNSTVFGICTATIAPGGRPDSAKRAAMAETARSPRRR